MAVTTGGAPSFSRPRSRSSVGVVATSSRLAVRPSRPLASRFHAPHRPSTDTATSPSTSVRSPWATNGRKRAKARNGSSITSRGSRTRAGTRASAAPPTTSAACTPNAHTPWRGVHTTATTNSSVATSFTWGAAAWTGLGPGTDRGTRWPAPMWCSALVPAADQPEEAGAAGKRDEHPGRARQADRHAGVVDAVDAVVGERTVGEAVVVRGADEALVLGNPLQAVGLARRVEAHPRGHHQRHGHHRDPPPAAVADAPHAATFRSAAALRPPSDGPGPLAPWTRSGRVASTAPTAAAVITPSPMPMSAWVPTIAASTSPRSTPVVPPMANSATKAPAASGTETKAARPAATSTPARLSGSTARMPRNT